MRTWQMKSTTLALIAVAVLAGCGKNPAAAPEGEKRVGQFQSVKKTGAAAPKAPVAAAKATTPTTPAKKPGVSTSTGAKPTTGTPATGGTTSPVTTGGTTQQAPATGEGALRLTMRLWGTSPVGSLKLKVYAAEATEGADIPLQLTGPEAVWEQDDMPAGQYTLHVYAYDPAGELIGKAQTQALVKDGELRDLTLDVTTRKTTPADGTSGIASTPTPGPTATPTPAPTATATPTPAATATPTPAPSGPGFGGTLGLRVEIF